MSRIAFIYPGQGAQKAGMGADFYEKAVAARKLYDAAGKALELNMRELCFEENDRLDLTEYTQAALVTTCLAITRVVKDAGIMPEITAGLSLGEYAAIAAAGGIRELDAIRLVRRRGILMQNTVPAGEGAMCAVIGLDTEKLEKMLDGMQDVTIANYNCPGQIVITGRRAAVEKMEDRLKEAGAKRTVMLNVSGPFHSPLLSEAGEKLEDELAETEFSPLTIPYITNVGAEKIEDISRTRELLKRQVSAPVCWMQSMELMISEGVDTFVEIGPGRTLAGFMKKIDRSVKVHNISSWEDVEKVCSYIAK